MKKYIVIIVMTFIVITSCCIPSAKLKVISVSIEKQYNGDINILANTAITIFLLNAVGKTVT